MRMKPGVPAMLGLVLFASIVAPVEAIAQAADASPLKHFEFSAPPDGPWQVDRSTSGVGSVTYLRKAGGAAYQIALLENVVLNPEFRKATAAWVADDFRAAERAGMEELGAGQYRVQDLRMGEETLGGKLYYTMSYVTEAGDYYQRARLYLHFPQAAANEYFLLAHYSEMARRRSDLKSSHEADFRRVLETVTHRPDQPAPAARGDAHRDAAEAYRAKDYETAAKLERVAADEGNLEAQTNLGTLYLTGLGVERNPEQAAAWYRKAAEEGTQVPRTTWGRCTQRGEASRSISSRRYACFACQRSKGMHVPN